jgi:hypothetical protein
MEGKTLFIFIDESGNLDFSPRGTKNFVLSCLSTFCPHWNRERIIRLRYWQLVKGHDQEFFHATEDKQEVRNGVFEEIKKLGNTAEIHSVVAQKNKANPALYKRSFADKRGRIVNKNVEEEFYQRVCRTLLSYVFKRDYSCGLAKIVVVVGAIFTKQKQSYILKTLKEYLKTCERPFEIYFHQAKADINCQLADYCGWAIFIKWERDELRSYELIKDKVKSEFEIFKNGTGCYY